MSVTVELGSWFEYEKAWWEHRHDPNVLLVKYEDMHAVSYVPWTGGHSRSGMGWLVFLVCVTCVSFIPNFYPAWDKGYVSGQALTIYVVISLNNSGTCIKRVEVIESFQLHWPHRRRTSPSQGSLCQNLILWRSHVYVHACMRIHGRWMQQPGSCREWSGLHQCVQLSSVPRRWSFNVDGHWWMRFCCFCRIPTELSSASLASWALRLRLKSCRRQ